LASAESPARRDTPELQLKDLKFEDFKIEIQSEIATPSLIFQFSNLQIFQSSNSAPATPPKYFPTPVAKKTTASCDLPDDTNTMHCHYLLPYDADMHAPNFHQWCLLPAPDYALTPNPLCHRTTSL
jgi:hypothetical protein